MGPDHPLIGPNQHILAIGRFLLTYNALESVLYTFLTHYLPAPRPTQMEIFRSLHNRARVDLIKGLARQREGDPSALEHVLHLLKCFDIASENRNILAHACADGGDENGNIILRKAGGNLPENVVEYRLSLQTLTEAADGVFVLYVRAAALRILVFHHTHESPSPDVPPLSSLEKWPIPEKLSLLGQTPAHGAAPYPPPPYVG